MTKLQFLLLPLALVSNLSSALAFEPGVIAKRCSSQGRSVKPTVSELGTLLKQVQVKYATQEARVADPNGFVMALDEIIRKSPFAHILTCRDRLVKDPHFTYQLKFQDPAGGNQDMFVTPAYEKRPVDNSVITHLTMEFNLMKSVQRVIFVYLHEMTHVCQMPEATKIYTQLTTDYEALNATEKSAYEFFEKEEWSKLGGAIQHRLERVDTATRDFYRQRFLGELEAFYQMQLAYTEFVKVSPELCTENPSDPDGNDFAAIYIKNENALLNGVFAQPIIYGYLDAYKTNERYLLDMNTTPIAYQLGDGPEWNFSLRKLDPAFKRSIERLGISVIEAP